MLEIILYKNPNGVTGYHHEDQKNKPDKKEFKIKLWLVILLIYYEFRVLFRYVWFLLLILMIIFFILIDLRDYIFNL